MTVNPELRSGAPDVPRDLGPELICVNVIKGCVVTVDAMNCQKTIGET
jgi:hypothetical protein